MNFKHLVALLRLRSQLTWNQIRKAGKLNVIISVIGLVCAALCTTSAFFIGMIGGAFWFQEASVAAVLVTWNVIVGLFLIIWLIGLMVELQQTEMMSLDKLLHLPISLRGAFFLNYTSSFFNTSFLLFVPTMFGLAIGMVFARGLGMSIAIPLIIGFLFLVTTITYQIRGWLARLMENKRRRGTIIAIMTIFFVCASQIPNLINMRNKSQRDEQRTTAKQEMADAVEFSMLETDAKIAAGYADPLSNGWQVEKSKNDLKRAAKAKRSEDRSKRRRLALGVVRQIDAYFPPAWLALGIANAAEGSYLTGLLAIAGMFAIGLISLTFSYRSSMKKYTGVEPKRKKSRSKSAEPKLQKLDLLFKQLPFVSEHVSSVTTASFRSLMRAPEAKMVLLMPLIFGLLFASFLLANKQMEIPNLFRPMIPIGVITMMMFAIISILFNQFGLDRDGFRALVLSPVKREDVLMGKNLSVIPLAFALCGVLIGMIQFFIPQDIFTLLASFIQIPAIYLLYCILGNVVSIFFPMGIKRGTMQPVNPRFVPMLIFMLGIMLAPGILLIPTMVACGIPMLLEFWFQISAGWLYFLLSIVQLVATVFVYRWSIKLQGNWLWKQESKILAIVSNIPE